MFESLNKMASTSRRACCFEGKRRLVSVPLQRTSLKHKQKIKVQLHCIHRLTSLLSKEYKMSFLFLFAFRSLDCYLWCYHCVEIFYQRRMLVRFRLFLSLFETLLDHCLSHNFLSTHHLVV